MSNIENIDSFLDNLLYHKNYSKETISNYKRDLKQLSDFIGDSDITTLSHQDILGWVKRAW